MATEKNYELTSYVSSESKKRAEELAEYFGRSVSNLIEWLINEKYKELKK